MLRVAITGIGIVSCLGNDPEAVSESLYHGRSGIVADPKRQDLGFLSPLTGLIRDFDPSHHLSRKQRKTMPDFAVQAHAAVMDGLAMARLDAGDIKNEETGLIFGCDSSVRSAVEQVDLLRHHGETRSIGSGHIFRSMNSTISMNLNTILGTKGACWTLSSACSSGGHAIGQAADLIALGRQNRMICGGAQEITWESVCSFDGLGAFSSRTETPHQASRPFDISRDGLVPSGGAAIVVLEEWELARRRGVKILGEVAGYAFSSDGGHISVPSPDGLFRAMTKCLLSARVAPYEVDYLCAHATSTPAGDSAEAEAIAGVFRDHPVPVSSVKSMTGHELWMSGASQVVYSLLMAEKGFIAPNLNYWNPDPKLPMLNIISETVEASLKHVLCNSAGFGGTNSCLLLRFPGEV
jgi:3-oxoacyl-[acyl-carrier-protein] synthase I